MSPVTSASGPPAWKCPVSTIFLNSYSSNLTCVQEVTNRTYKLTNNQQDTKKHAINEDISKDIINLLQK